MNAGKVLIIEDQPLVAQLIAEWVQPFATEVLFAKDWFEAMQRLEFDHPFGLVTLDLGLPDSQRFATVAKIPFIREQNPNGLVIVITGFKDPELERKALSMGAHGWLDKPTMTTQPGFFRDLLNTIKGMFTNPTHYKQHGEMAALISSKIAEATSAAQTAAQVQNL